MIPNQRSLANTIYSLMRQYKVMVTFVDVSASETDYETGERKIGKRAIYLVPTFGLPETQKRKFMQDIGYLAANKNFTYGGLNTFSDRSFIVLGRNLPFNYDHTMKGYVIIDNKRYEKVLVTNICEGIDLYDIKEYKNNTPYNIIPINIEQRLLIDQGVICDRY